MKTPRSRIVSHMRSLWLRSSERGAALKRDKYTCQDCGAKQSKAKGKEQKVQVHHKEGVLNWDELIEAIRAYLLTDPENLETLCPDCHKQHG